MKLLPLLFLLSKPGGYPSSGELLVAAASDLMFTFKELGSLFEKRTGVKVTFLFGSSGTLARQIEQGAPVDLFFSANEAFLDDLLRKGRLVQGTETLYARGRIVLASSKRSGLKLRGLQELLKPEVKKVAIANPTHAPYGKAAKEALETLGLWKRLWPKLVYAENVRQVLQYLETGDVEAGILALSLTTQPEIPFVLLDENLYRPILQKAAVVKGSQNPALAWKFLAFVTGPEGRRVLKRYGFTFPGEF